MRARERKRKGEERHAPLLPILLMTKFFSVARERHSQRKRESKENEEEGRESQRRRVMENYPKI